jgi:hypothetical protein
MVGLPYQYTYSNGHTTTVTYNNRNLTTGLTAGSSAVNMDYTYDTRGNTSSVTNQLDPTANETLTYDALNRIATINGTWGQYSYDDVGNRLTKAIGSTATTYGYTNNRLNSSTAGGIITSYSYNNDGDMVLSGTHSLGYDDFHRLISYDQTQYTYDGDGMRVSKVENNKTTIYHYDHGGRVLSENDENDNLIADYVFLHGKLIAKIAPIPAKPANLQAWAAYTAQINLKWDDNTDEQGYTIERKTGSGSYSILQTVAANQTTYSDAGLTPGLTYSYRVSAYNQAGSSAVSNEASAIPVSNPVPILTVAPTSWNTGTVIVGSAPVTKTFTITNSGTNDLRLYVVNYFGTYGPNNSAYTITSDMCSALTLHPRDVCTFGLRFTPQATGIGQGNINIPSAQLASVNVPITGAGQKQFSLTVQKNGTGAGTVTSAPAGINCGTDCTEIYNATVYTETASVTLTPTPSSSSFMAHWSGGGCSGAGPCTVNLVANTTVTATFDLIPSAVVGVFKDGIWNLDLNNNGVLDVQPVDLLYSFGVGITGAVPVTGDWTGMGLTKIGVYTNGTWYIDRNGNGVWDGTPIDALFSFGTGMAGAIPVTGDWTGTGSTKIGMYSDGTWYVDLNGNGWWDGTPTDGIYSFGAGMTGEIPVTGDWTGTGTTKIGVYTNGTWYIDRNGNGAWDGTPIDTLYSFGIGMAGAIPVTGDWTASGSSKIGVVNDSIWYLDLNGNGAWEQGTDKLVPDYGVPAGIPVAGSW